MTAALDSFGNKHAEGLPYARGEIITSNQDDYRKLQCAWKHIRDWRGANKRVWNFSGLERSLRTQDVPTDLFDDELSPALWSDELHDLALDHLGGEDGTHDFMLANRLTAAIYVAMQVMVPSGSTVIGVSASYSHPAVTRAVRDAGGRFVDTVGFSAFQDALDQSEDVRTIVITRLAVTYEPLSDEDLARIVELARERDCLIFVDDAGGARVGPAALGQPKTLKLGADVGATGLDKYGTVGPRLGVLVGRRELVSQMRSRMIELGMEARPMLYPAVVHSLKQYRPERVRELVATTKLVGEAIREFAGDRLHETPVIVQLHGEQILAEVLDRAGRTEAAIVPYEATACLAMLLLRDYGIMTVHFAGLPPGTAALMIKFIPPEELEMFGGAHALARAVDESLDKVADIVGDPDRARELLFG